MQLRGGSFELKERRCRRSFFPLRTVLRIDGHGYSPAILDKMVTAGGDCKSFEHSSRQLGKLAEIRISHTQVSKLTHEIGRELIDVRDHRAELHRYRQLPADPHQPQVDLACIESDGGRMMPRAPDQPRGVHDEQWKEPKVGVLWKMTEKRSQKICILNCHAVFKTASGSPNLCGTSTAAAPEPRTRSLNTASR